MTHPWGTAPDADPMTPIVEHLAVRFRASISLVPPALWMLLSDEGRVRVGLTTQAQARRLTTVDAVDTLVADLDQLLYQVYRYRMEESR